MTTKPERRAISLRVNVNPEEAEQIRKQAELEQRSVSAYLRCLALVRKDHLQ